MSAVFSLASSPELFAREESRFRDSLAPLTQPGGLDAPAPHRIADRYAAVERLAPGTSRTRRTATRRSRRSASGVPRSRPASPRRRSAKRAVQEARLTSAEQLESVLGRVRAAGTEWGQWSGAARGRSCTPSATRSRRTAPRSSRSWRPRPARRSTRRRRGLRGDRLRATSTASSPQQLDDVDGASFTPAALTLVTPPWNFPVAIPPRSTLAALAAGSAVVVLKPAPPAERCGARARIGHRDRARRPRGTADVLAFVQVAEDDLGKQLIAAPQVDRVILTGAYETAGCSGRSRPTCRCSRRPPARTRSSSRPSADLDLAVKDVVASAFGTPAEVLGCLARGARGVPWRPRAGFRSQLSTPCRRSPSGTRPTRRRRWVRSSSPRPASCSRG